ncbi:MAG: TolC family protein [Candidatus Aminicenantes bacterium]|nr:TolC family protein [Candidatus Aminicenantes bacterium]
MANKYRAINMIHVLINKRILIALSVIFLLLIQINVLKAESVLILDLKSIKELAIKHNKTLKNARLDIKIARNIVRETTATGLPQIEGKLSYQDMTQIPTTLIPAQFIDPDADEGTYFPMKFGTRHNMSFEIVASQLVFNGTYIVALQSSKIYMRLSRESLIKTEIEVKSLVTGTYYLILVSENLKNILEKNLESLKKLHFETSELFKAGFVEETDVDQMEYFVIGIKNRLSSIKRQIEISYKLLKFQIGFELDKEITIGGNINSISENIDYNYVLAKEFDLFGHIDFKIADTQVKSSSLLLKKEKSLFLPSLTAFVSHSQNAMRNEFNFFKENEDKWFPTTVIGLNMNIPIFSSGIKISKVKQAKYDLEKSINKKSDVVDGLKLGYMNTRSAYLTAIGGKESSFRNLQIAGKIYNRTIEKFKKGVSSSLELIQAYNQYLESQFTYTSALIEYYNSLTELQKYLNII